MRIRTFTADAAREAIDRVRAEMGDEAVIISLDEAANGRGVIVRAALDSDGPEAPLPMAAEAAPSAIASEQRLERLLLDRLGLWPAERPNAAFA